MLPCLIAVREFIAYAVFSFNDRLFEWIIDPFAISASHLLSMFSTSGYLYYAECVADFLSAIRLYVISIMTVFLQLRNKCPSRSFDRVQTAFYNIRIIGKDGNLMENKTLIPPFEGPLSEFPSMKELPEV